MHASVRLRRQDNDDDKTGKCALAASPKQGTIQKNEGGQTVVVLAPTGLVCSLNAADRAGRVFLIAEEQGLANLKNTIRSSFPRFSWFEEQKENRRGVL